jgi:hypothetical protein
MPCSLQKMLKNWRAKTNRRGRRLSQTGTMFYYIISENCH